MVLEVLEGTALNMLRNNLFSLTIFQIEVVQKIICFNNRQVIISSPCMFLLSIYTFKNFFYTSYTPVYIYRYILTTHLKMTKV